MSDVQAKFRLSNVQDATYAPEGAVNLTMMAVEGEPFGSATPNGYLTMTIHNSAAAKVFKNAYAEYIAEIEKRRALDSRTTPAALSAYPSQPEFYVTFHLDKESHAPAEG